MSKAICNQISMRTLLTGEPAIADGLPSMAFVISPYTGQISIVYKGESVFYGTGLRTREQTVELNNERRGITRAQAAAMCAGAFSGWDTPRADPANYDADGNFKGGNKYAGR